MKLFTIALVGMALSLGMFSCDEADKVENKITCGEVCSRYRDCFDSDYNVDQCTDSCEAEANANQAKDHRLEVCNTCIDDQSCTAAAFDCATDCSGIIVL